MRIKILTLKYSDRLDMFDTNEIDDFIKDKDIIEIRDHFFLAGGSPRLTIILTYNSADYPKATVFKKQAESYKQYMTDDDWPLFNSLKDWRNSCAKNKGIPPYIIFDNEQLASPTFARPICLAVKSGRKFGENER